MYAARRRCNRNVRCGRGRFPGSAPGPTGRAPAGGTGSPREEARKGWSRPKRAERPTWDRPGAPGTGPGAGEEWRLTVPGYCSRYVPRIEAPGKDRLDSASETLYRKMHIKTVEGGDK